MNSRKYDETHIVNALKISLRAAILIYDFQVISIQRTYFSAIARFFKIPRPELSMKKDKRRALQTILREQTFRGMYDRAIEYQKNYTVMYSFWTSVTSTLIRKIISVYEEIYIRYNKLNPTSEIYYYNYNERKIWEIENLRKENCLMESLAGEIEKIDDVSDNQFSEIRELNGEIATIKNDARIIREKWMEKVRDLDDDEKLPNPYTEFYYRKINLFRRKFSDEMEKVSKWEYQVNKLEQKAYENNGLNRSEEINLNNLHCETTQFAGKVGQLQIDVERFEKDYRSMGAIRK